MCQAYNRTMRILGIDPGYGRVGWGVISTEKGKTEVLGFGTYETKAHTHMSLRLKNVYEALQRIITEYNPDEMAVEELFFTSNEKTVIHVAQGRGVILLAGETANILIAEYTPLEIKMAVTGYGRAEKKQVADIVKMLLHLEHTPKIDDTTDALATALTHLYSRKMKSI